MNVIKGITFILLLKADNIILAGKFVPEELAVKKNNEL
jgi:hypothetical protein